MNRTDYLQALVDNVPHLHGGFVPTQVVFVPCRGWYLEGEPRYIGDDGRDWIGWTWKDAERFILPFVRVTFGKPIRKTVRIDDDF